MLNKTSIEQTIDALVEVAGAESLAEVAPLLKSAIIELAFPKPESDTSRIMLRWQKSGQFRPTKAFTQWVKDNPDKVSRSEYRKASDWTYAIITLLSDSAFDELVNLDFFGAELCETDDIDRAWYWVDHSRYTCFFDWADEDTRTFPWNYSASTKRQAILNGTSWEEMTDWQEVGYSDPDFETITPDEIRTLIEENHSYS